MVIYGVTLILCVQFLPGGLISLVETAWRARAREKIPMALLEISRVSLSFSGPARIWPMYPSNVAEGEIVGLIGPNGAGKSTLIELHFAPVRPESLAESVSVATISPLAKAHEVAAMGIRRPSRIWSCFARRPYART